MTAAAILTAVREHGADFRIVDGQLRLSRASRVPAAIVDEIRAHKDAVRRVLETPAAQIPMAFAAAPAPKPGGFWQKQDARFDALLREFGVPFTSAKKRSAAR